MYSVRFFDSDYFNTVQLRKTLQPPLDSSSLGHVCFYFLIFLIYIF